MKSVADDHADSLCRQGAADPADALILDIVAADLRALYGDAAADLPEALVGLARRLDAPRRSEILAA